MFKMMVQGVVYMISDLRAMMQAFKGLEMLTNNTEQTFMQLTDYPHLENVCSNVLAFFFDTAETHNFRSLFIKSLLECAGADANCRSAECIEREVATDKGNRIDIFIETDKYLIAIENKVFSGLNNPLADYAEHTYKLSRTNDKETLFILLTLKDESVGGSAFINVTYAKLFASIRKKLGAYVVTANTKWIVILNDFIRTIEELQGGVILDREFIEFYNENKADIDVLLKAKRNLTKSLKAKLQAVMNMVSIDSPLTEGKFSISYDDCSAEYYLTHKSMMEIGESVHWIIYIDTKSCDILIGIDNATIEQKTSLERLLKDRGFKYSSWTYNTDYLLVKKLDVFEAEEVIATEFQNVLNKLV